jgi:hypothetical protein
MTKPTMTSQWDPGNYRPLDMSKIPGYPRKMPLSYKRWVPRFFGRDGESPDYHMSKFWEFFQYYPVRDEAEDLVMKLFSASLHEEAKKWYDSLPAASITSMDHFEEIFLERWALKLEDVQTLLKELEGVRQENGEFVKFFGTKFQKLFHQIPESHRPGGKFLVYLFTNGLQAHLSFLLNKRKPETLEEARNMAIQIERNLLSRGISSFTMDALTLMRIVSHENFDENTQEVKERVFNQQNENVIEEQELERNDEVSTCAPPADEIIQEPVSPVQQSEDEVSHFPLQNSNNTVLLDSKEEEEMEASDKIEVPCRAIEDEETTHAENTRVLEVPAQEETVSYPPLIIFDDALPCNEKEEEEESSKPACYDTDTDIADLDEFIHVGRRRWDVIGYDLDPIYDTESHLQLFPLQLSQQITYDQWQQGDEVFACSFQNTKDDLVPCFSDDFQSYLEMFDEYAEHLNPFYEDDYRPPLCSDFGTSKDIVCLKEVTHDFSSQPPVTTSPCFSIQGVVGNYLFRVEFPPGQTLDFKGWLGNAISINFSTFS